MREYEGKKASLVTKIIPAILGTVQRCSKEILVVVLILYTGKFYRTAIRPVMLYGAECWSTKRRHVQQLSVAEMRMLRWFCGHTRRDKVQNEVIRERVGVAPN